MHEIGERRAVPFLRKFHPWYLRRGTFAAHAPAASSGSIATLEALEARLFAEAPGARALVELHAAADAIDHAADAELGLPISVYGGG